MLSCFSRIHSDEWIHPGRHSCECPKYLKMYAAMLCDGVYFQLTQNVFPSCLAWPSPPSLLQIAFFIHKGDEGLQS